MSEADVRPSKKQHELLVFIQAFIAQHGYGPSYREIMRALDYKSVSTVAVHIDNLIAKGHLRKRDNSARSLEICDAVAKDVPVAKPVTRAQEKWLVELIGKQFARHEAESRNSDQLDELYVLVGALHVLGFSDAARSFQSRLQTLKQNIAK